MGIHKYQNDKADSSQMTMERYSNESSSLHQIPKSPVNSTSVSHIAKPIEYRSASSAYGNGLTSCSLGSFCNEMPSAVVSRPIASTNTEPGVSKFYCDNLVNESGLNSHILNNSTINAASYELKCDKSVATKSGCLSPNTRAAIERKRQEAIAKLRQRQHAEQNGIINSDGIDMLPKNEALSHMNLDSASSIHTFTTGSGAKVHVPINVSNSNGLDFYNGISHFSKHAYNRSVD